MRARAKAEERANTEIFRIAAEASERPRREAEARRQGETPRREQRRRSPGLPPRQERGPILRPR